jgi:hypothetical protein
MQAASPRARDVTHHVISHHSSLITGDAMPWWDFLKRSSAGLTESRPRPAATPPRGPAIVGKRPRGGAWGGRRPGGAHDPQARERRRKRLQKRVTDLRYDLGQAQAALGEPNRWTERIDGVTRAIELARADAEATLAAPTGRSPIALPPLPVTVEQVQPVEPATVRFRVGQTPFHYQEELDWAERGTQRAPGVLGRAEGDVDALLPAGVPAARQDELREHLAHALATFAEQLRDEPAASDLTLADLASPCPVCCGWRDLKGRCPACQERQWRAERLRADADRLLRERAQLQDELQRVRDRLPILQRQLADAEADLAAAS